MLNQLTAGLALTCLAQASSATFMAQNSPAPDTASDLELTGSCGPYSRADRTEIYQMAKSVARTYGSSPIPPYYCERLRCQGTAGLYVCNDNVKPQWIPNRTLGEAAISLAGACASNAHTKLESGEIFLRDYNSSVIVGYAVCGFTRFRRPETYPAPAPYTYVPFGTNHPRCPYDQNPEAKNGAPQPFPRVCLISPT